MTHQERPQNLARRRLARGAVVTPVVIASLTSKNALAGKFHCSVSGKASGHGSQTDDDKVCNDIGHGCEYWKNKCRDDRTEVKNCIGVDYKGKTSGNSHKRTNWNCSDSSYKSATCAQILNGQDVYPQIKDPALLLVGMCAYLNARDVTDYYITTKEAAELYKCAAGYTGEYRKEGNKPLLQQDCRDLLMSLYRP